MQTSSEQPGSAHNGADHGEPPGEAFREAMSHIGELKSYAGHYVAAKLDGMKLSARKAVFLAVIGIVALLAAASMIVAASVMALSGLAQAIAALLGGRMWAGNLVVGAGLLALVTLGTWLAMRRLFGSTRKATVDRYERRIQQQRVQHGHDARQRSAEYSQSH